MAPEIERAIHRKRGGGQALDREIRGQMEAVFGTHFGGVRLHSDSESDALNRSLNARAFTTGQDIFFRHGAYAPGSSAGQELLAHELTHVVQQRDEVQRKLTLGQPGDIYEQEADEMARVATRAESGLPGRDRPDGHRADALRRRANKTRVIQNTNDDEDQAFTPTLVRTEEWSAEIWGVPIENLFMREKIADLSVTFSYGRDAGGRYQIWGPDGDATTYDPRIGIGPRISLARIVNNAMDMELEFGIAGPGVSIVTSRASQQGGSLEISRGIATIGLTSGTVETQSYGTTGSGSRSSLKRRYRIGADGRELVFQRDPDLTWTIRGAGGEEIFRLLRIRRERFNVIESMNLQTEESIDWPLLRERRSASPPSGIVPERRPA